MKILLVITAVLVAVSFSLFHAYAQEQGITSIPIGKTALDIQISGDKAYVTNPEEGVISVIDTTTKQVVDTIPAEKGVMFAQVVEDKNKIYATVENQNKVFVYDLTTHEKINEINIGEKELVLFSKADKPYGQREYTYFATSGVGLEYDHNNGMLYVVHSEVNHVNVIDTNDDEVVGTINVGTTPVMIAIDEAGNAAYVTNWESNDVSIIDLNTNEVTGQIKTGFVPAQMVIDSEEHKLYVTHHASPHVSVVDLTTKEIEKQVKLQGPTSALALDKKAGLLIVTYLPESGITGQSFLNRVEFIDTKTNEQVSGYDIAANPFVMKIDENDQLFASIIKEGRVVLANLPEIEKYQQVVAKSEEKPKEDKKSGCLVATASFGTELAPQVQLLRETRDNVLFGTGSGTAFMVGFNEFYYSFSPTVADWERQSPIFKEIVKTGITPMISTLSILNYVHADSEQQVLGYGIGVILLNIGMYFVAPAIIIFKIKQRLQK
ncbi:MAG: YncE family protein [Thaumarchaeota archaeon]|nr:YncE family protein [Nitrososphaerota archaeon]